VTCARQGPLALYCYSRRAVYEKLWTQAALMARGLILDTEERAIAATPFPKFFNVGEHQGPIPDVPFETLAKVDGSLIIIYWHRGEWKTATKGSLNSDQAQWANRKLATLATEYLDAGVTYLCEAVYPENRIVVHYDREALVLLAAYDASGFEFNYPRLQAVADDVGFELAQRFDYAHVSELVATAKTLPANDEGFVLRFENGLRLKVKGDEYCRIHALISRCTPLAMWEAMKDGTNLAAVRADLPEEFWADFDGIVDALGNQFDTLVTAIDKTGQVTDHLTDKELGLMLKEIPERIRSFVFPRRKHAGNVDAMLSHPRTREALFRAIRPTGNRLEGYRPSYAINRVLMEEAA
jgi:RNA ligase